MDPMGNIQLRGALTAVNHLLYIVLKTVGFRALKRVKIYKAKFFPSLFADIARYQLTFESQQSLFISDRMRLGHAS